MSKQMMLVFTGVFLLAFSIASQAAPPETPNLYVSTDGLQVSLYWDEVAGAERYTVLATNANDGSSFGQFDLGANSRITTTLPEGSEFFVSVRAENSDGNSAFSIPRLLVVQPAIVSPTVIQVIQNYGRNVIYNTYIDLARRAEILRTAVIELQLDTSSVTLAKAQRSWRDTRRAWEQSEAFLFGPVDTQGLDPALDSWPLNAVDLQNVLDSGAPLTTASVSAFDPTLKGFHAIEFLLFGGDSQKVFSDLTARELTYLSATVNVLFQDAQTLAEAWNPNGGNFFIELAQAGVGSTTYTSMNAAVQEMVNGMIGIADEVGNAKILDPLTAGDTTLVESQFSFNSRSDFMDNIRGIRNVYTGNYSLSEGPGLNALVKQINPSLDQTINDSIEQAIAAIHAIPQPFAESITANSAAVQDAANAVNALQALLESQLLPLASSL